MQHKQRLICGGNLALDGQRGFAVRLIPVRSWYVDTKTPARRMWNGTRAWLPAEIVEAGVLLGLIWCWPSAFSPCSRVSSQLFEHPRPSGCNVTPKAGLACSCPRSGVARQAKWGAASKGPGSGQATDTTSAFGLNERLKRAVVRDR